MKRARKILKRAFIKVCFGRYIYVQKLQPFYQREESKVSSSTNYSSICMSSSINTLALHPLMSHLLVYVCEPK